MRFPEAFWNESNIMKIIEDLEAQILSINNEIKRLEKVMNDMFPNRKLSYYAMCRTHSKIVRTTKYQDLNEQWWILVLRLRKLKLKLNQLRQKYWCW